MTGRPKKSRRRSNTKRRPKPPVYFIDAALDSKIVLKALGEAEFLLERLVDHFPSRTDDIDWMPEVGKHRWVVLSKDRFRKNDGAEFAAILNAKLAVFVVADAHWSAPDTAAVLVAAKRRMESMLRRETRPFVARVGSSGRVTLTYNTAKLRRKYGRTK